MFPPSCLLLTSSFHDTPNVFSWRRVWTGARYPDSSTLKLCCCNRCNMWVLARPSLKKTGAYVALTFVSTVQLWWRLFRCASFQFYKHWCTSIITKIQAFEYAGSSLSSFVWRTAVHIFNNKFQVLFHLTTKELSISLQSLLNELRPWKP